MNAYRTLAARPRASRTTKAVVLALALFATAACNDTVQVLNAPIESSSASPNFASTVLAVGPYRSDAMVFITANGSARRTGPARPAGVMVSILTSPRLQIVAQDDALGIPARVMSYRASAAYSFRLPAGERRIIGGIASPLGATAPALTNSQIRLTAVALKVR